MGNWRTVHLKGTCAPEHVPELRAFLSRGFTDPGWGCLHSGGIWGLQNWAGETFEAVGNLGERDFEPEDVAEELRKIIRDVAPSLKAQVDCGADRESLECVATVLVGEDSTVAVLPPAVDTIPPVDAAAADMRFLRSIMRGGK